MNKKISAVAIGAVAIITAALALTVPQSSPQSSISRTYSLGQCDKGFCWTCKTAVNLDSVSIVIDENTERVDGVKFAPGCTGTIGSLNILTSSSDAVKVAEGAHDLTVNGGTITCLDKLPTLHQDGIQVMGGSNLLFNGLIINCGRAEDDLIDSNFFINLAGNSTVPPLNVVCDGCWFGPQTAHTVNLEASTNSGVRNSTLCPGKFPRLTFTIGNEAVNPINENNTFPTAC